MIVITVNQYTCTMFFFYIIEEVVMIVTISQNTPSSYVTKYIVTLCTPNLNCYKFLLTFFTSSIRMSRKNVNFEDKKNQKK